jgi:predicted GNAT family acetyltransferase
MVANGSGESLLDNVVWYSLTSHHAHLAIGGPLAKRYPPDISPAVALPKHDESSLHALKTIVAPGETVGLLERHPPETVPGWEIQFVAPVSQMVRRQLPSQEILTTDIVPLTASDMPAMMHLLALAQPGPLFPRSIELGSFLGIRVGGELVAMAGQRFHTSGYQEICTICTHPDHQGKGYARRLTSFLVQTIWARGEIPFLHVNGENTRAIRLYTGLHFETRCEVQLIVVNY